MIIASLVVTGLIFLIMLIFFIVCIHDNESDETCAAIFFFMAVFGLAFTIIYTQADTKQISYQEVTPKEVIIGLNEISAKLPDASIVNMSMTSPNQGIQDARVISPNRIRVGISTWLEQDGDTVVYKNILIK